MFIRKQSTPRPVIFEMISSFKDEGPKVHNILIFFFDDIFYFTVFIGWLTKISLIRGLNVLHKVTVKKGLRLTSSKILAWTKLPLEVGDCFL